MNKLRTGIAIALTAYATNMLALWPFSNPKKDNKLIHKLPTDDQYPSYFSSEKTKPTPKKNNVITSYEHLNNTVHEEALAYLTAFGFDKQEFTQFKGTLQQCEVNDALIDLLNRVCSNTQLFTTRSMPWPYIVIDLIIHVHTLNKNQQLEDVSQIIQALLDNKEEHIGRVRTIINKHLPAEYSDMGSLIFNNIAQDLSIYSGQLLCASFLEMMINQFMLPAPARAARLEELLSTLKNELFSIYHPVTTYQKTLIEETMLLVKGIVVDQHEQLFKEFFTKEYKTLK